MLLAVNIVGAVGQSRYVSTVQRDEGHPKKPDVLPHLTDQ